MQISQSSSTLVACGFVILSGLSIHIASREYPAAANAGNWQVQNIAALEKPREMVAVSILSDRWILDKCLEATASPASFLAPDDARISMLANCGAMTKHIIKSSRGSSYAWFALARFETELSGMTDGFEAAILKSYATGPSEVWIAEQRVLLIEQTVEFVSPIVITNHLEDIELLVQTARGVRGIARLYVNYSDFRERVIAVVETLPNDVQARFLANVKRAAAETFSDE